MQTSLNVFQREKTSIEVLCRVRPLTVVNRRLREGERLPGFGEPFTQAVGDRAVQRTNRFEDARFYRVRQTQ